MTLLEPLSFTAFSLGLLHALEPGHGKTLMAGTLVGSSRKWLDPIAIGVSTAGGHAVGILVFVSAAFFLAHEVAADEVRDMVELMMGAVVVVIALSLLVRVLKARNRKGIALGTVHDSCGSWIVKSINFSKQLICGSYSNHDHEKPPASEYARVDIASLQLRVRVSRGQAELERVS